MNTPLGTNFIQAHIGIRRSICLILCYRPKHHLYKPVEKVAGRKKSLTSTTHGMIPVDELLCGQERIPLSMDTNKRLPI